MERVFWWIYGDLSVRGQGAHLSYSITIMYALTEGRSLPSVLFSFFFLLDAQRRFCSLLVNISHIWEGKVGRGRADKFAPHDQIVFGGK